MPMNTEHRGLEYFRAGDQILPIDGIYSVDTAQLERHEVTVFHRDGVFRLTGADAIDLVMIVKPSALEGRRLRWVRGAWAGHVGMQILAWLKIPTWGVWLHEATTPRPQTSGQRFEGGNQGGASAPKGVTPLKVVK
jgi:hypothetical protein